MAVSFSPFCLQASQRLEAINVFNAGDLDEVGQLEELLNVLLGIPVLVFHINDFENFLGSVTMNLVAMVVKVEDVG